MCFLIWGWRDRLRQELQLTIEKQAGMRYTVVTVHGALHLAARHPASKIAVSGIQPLAGRRLFNGLDALQFAAG